MSYPAATPDRELNEKPGGPDPVLAMMVRDLVNDGWIEMDNADNLGAEYIESARQMLMNELCEPVTAEVGPGRIVFRRVWAR